MNISVIAIFLDGEMYLIENKLSAEQIRILETLSKEFLFEHPELIECSEKEIFEGFVIYVNEKLEIHLNSVDVSYVVRLNKKTTNSPKYQD